MHVAAGDVVAERDVARLVHGNRTHPAIVPVAGREGPLLIHSGRAARTSDFIPAQAHDAARGNGMVYDERLAAAQVAIGQAIHQTVAERVKLLSGPALGDAKLKLPPVSLWNMLADR